MILATYSRIFRRLIASAHATDESFLPHNASNPTEPLTRRVSYDHDRRYASDGNPIRCGSGRARAAVPDADCERTQDLSDASIGSDARCPPHSRRLRASSPRAPPPPTTPHPQGTAQASRTAPCGKSPADAPCLFPSSEPRRGIRDDGNSSCFKAPR